MIAVGVVDIPKGCQLIAGEVVEEGAKAGGVGEYAAGLEQDGQAKAFGVGNENAERAADALIVVAQSHDTDIRHLHIVGDLHDVANVVQAVLAGDIAGGVKHRNGELFLPKLTDGGRGIVFMEGTAAIGQRGGLMDIVDLNASEAHVQGGLDVFFPADVEPAAGGE